MARFHVINATIDKTYSRDNIEDVIEYAQQKNYVFLLLKSSAYAPLLLDDIIKYLMTDFDNRNGVLSIQVPDIQHQWPVIFNLEPDKYNKILIYFNDQFIENQERPLLSSLYSNRDVAPWIRELIKMLDPFVITSLEVEVFP